MVIGYWFATLSYIHRLPDTIATFDIETFELMLLVLPLQTCFGHLITLFAYCF